MTSKLYRQQTVTPSVCNVLLNQMSLKREWEEPGEKTILLLHCLAQFLREGSTAGWDIGQISYNTPHPLPLSLVNTRAELLLQVAATKGPPRQPETADLITILCSFRPLWISLWQGIHWIHHSFQRPIKHCSSLQGYCQPATGKSAFPLQMLWSLQI